MGLLFALGRWRMENLLQIPRLQDGKPVVVLVHDETVFVGFDRLLRDRMPHVSTDHVDLSRTNRRHDVGVALVAKWLAVVGDSALPRVTNHVTDLRRSLGGSVPPVGGVLDPRRLLQNGVSYIAGVGRRPKKLGPYLGVFVDRGPRC